ncbi:MAG: hypothetical protein ACOCXA_03015, partial [Planctomycetota bacterium]
SQVGLPASPVVPHAFDAREGSANRLPANRQLVFIQMESDPGPITSLQAQQTNEDLVAILRKLLYIKMNMLQKVLARSEG